MAAPTVFICLDDAELAAAVEARFRLFGWHRVAALAKEPDLVVLDGRADFLIRAMKSDARTSRLTVVAIGGYGAAEQKSRCIDAGALAYIERPIELEQFDTLTRFIEHGRSGAVRGHPNKSHARPAPAALAGR